MCCHPPAGFTGLILGPIFFFAIFFSRYFSRSPGPYHMDPKGEAKAFEPILERYVKAVEFIIGIATGSTVLLAGSSVYHGQGGQIPWIFDTPLLLLSWSVVFGVAFMVWLNYCYEAYQHGVLYTNQKYSLTEALGFGSLVCFFSGYISLLLLITK